MLIKIIQVVVLVATINISMASSFFVPDSDSATLIEIAMILSKDLKTTLKLLETAKNTQNSLGKFHDSLARKYYLSQRIMFRIERLKRLNKVRPKTLRELNYALYQIKSLLRSLKKLFSDAGRELIKTEDELLINEEYKMAIKQNRKLLEMQEDRSVNSDNILENTSQTAINTAQSNLLLNDLNRNILNSNRYQLINNKFQLMKIMREVDDEEKMRKWAGLDDYELEGPKIQKGK